MHNLAGQYVVVVGAGSGMGRATAIHAAREGAYVHLVARSHGRLEDVAREIGKAASFSAADMTDRDALAAAMAPAKRIDHLVITAISDEWGRRAGIAAVTPEQVERSFDRLRGYVNCLQVTHPRFNGKGSVTLWCGASAIRPPESRFSLLAAENASIAGFGRALARELAPVRVNVLMAGVVDTPIHAHQRDAVQEWAERALPVARLGQPDDLAHAALFLMTNPYLTGQTVVVDGGFSLI